MYTSINHNMMAANTARNLNSHYSNLATSTQRLSSGLRINSAADDAAGLAIRELQRADIAALHQGARNANDAISMIQVADGALGIIDEKLIRMKELAEQAATGTYDSTQRLMIDSEFQAMAAEIDRIANATDFNGIHLLNGSLSGKHNGSGLNSTGSMKIHFGSGNDSAEDYYYVEIGDCTTKGLGLHYNFNDTTLASPTQVSQSVNTPKNITLNDCTKSSFQRVRMPATGISNMQDLLSNGGWTFGIAPESYPPRPSSYNNFMFLIPAGTKNIIINTNGSSIEVNPTDIGHNDLQLFTTTGKHLAGTPLDDIAWHFDDTTYGYVTSSIDGSSDRLPFTSADYDGSQLNMGPTIYPGDQTTLALSTYNGMTIGYSGDGDRYDAIPNDAISQTWPDYQLLTINEATEDLIIMFPGAASGFIKAYWDVPDDDFTIVTSKVVAPSPDDDGNGIISIKTQDNAQKALTRINDAIVQKDKIRAHLGALQNRLENTVSNLNIQAENLQAAESRISDVDVATEMTGFVRNQILTQSATAMLGQANSMPQMMMQLIGG